MLDLTLRAPEAAAVPEGNKSVIRSAHEENGSGWEAMRRLHPEWEAGGTLPELGKWWPGGM